MKITQKIQLSENEDRIWWSFEYFPPRTAQVLIIIESDIVTSFSISLTSGFAKPTRSHRTHERSWSRIHRYYLASFLSYPSHVSYFDHRNAGGRTSELTSEMVKTCQSLIGMETCMHLTCTNMPKEKVDIALRVRV